VGAIAQGQVVLCACHGRRDTSGRDPVTSRTRFPIGSLTKPFTATILAKLVEAGILCWDEPVWRYLPEFRLHDSVAGAQATLRDLLSHRTGVPEHDLVWYGTGPALDEIPERLRLLTPTEPFRSRWQYQNMAFAVAALAASRVVKRPWQELVAGELLAPLGLRWTGFLRHFAPGEGEAAGPHLCVRGLRRRLRWRTMEDGIDPVGGMVSCLDDLLVFLRFHLAGGVHEDKQLISNAALAELYRAQILIEAAGPCGSPGLAHGLGFFVTSHQGRKIAMHAGRFDGFEGLLSFMPDRGLGCVALSNLMGENPVPRIATAVVRDLLLGEDPERWFEEALVAAEAEPVRERLLPLHDRHRGPSHPIREYMGRFVHPGHSEIKITRHGTRHRLSFALNGRVRPLRHLYHNVFLVIDELPGPLADARILFGYDLEGRIDTLGLRPSADAPLLWFRRVAAE
jgi:CubicO group peptidase (beta-lactamase class C family)